MTGAGAETGGVSFLSGVCLTTVGDGSGWFAATGVASSGSDFVFGERWNMCPTAIQHIRAHIINKFNLKQHFQFFLEISAILILVEQ